MTWFRRAAKPAPRPPTSRPPTPTVPRAGSVPSWSADLTWWSDPVVRLTFADDSVVELRADDPRTRAFVALADLLVGSSGSPVRPI
jgi:hypothetical protein